MKKLSKKQKRQLLLIAAVVIVVLAVSLLRQQQSPGGAGLYEPPEPTAALVTLPPAETAAPPAAGEPETASPSEASAPAETDDPAPEYPEDISYTDGGLDEYGTYSGVEDVACYIYTFGHLPHNYITKAEAQDAGWVSNKGNLWDVAYGACIGGDRFGNYEGLLPKGKQYYECDVNYEGGYRGEERLIFTNDGDVYYTADHYRSFERLY